LYFNFNYIFLDLIKGKTIAKVVTIVTLQTNNKKK